MSAAVFCLCIAVVDSQIEAVPALADGSAVLDQSLFSHVMFSSVHDGDVETAGTENLMLTCSASVHISPTTSRPQRERTLLHTMEGVSRSSLRRTLNDTETIVLAGDSAVTREVIGSVPEVMPMASPVPIDFDNWWMFADVPDDVLAPLCPPENQQVVVLVVRTAEQSLQVDPGNSLNGDATDPGRNFLHMPLVAVQHPMQSPLPFLEFAQLGTTARNRHLIVPVSDTFGQNESLLRQIDDFL